MNREMPLTLEVFVLVQAEIAGDWRLVRFRQQGFDFLRRPYVIEALFTL